MGNPLDAPPGRPVTTKPQYEKVLDYIRIAKDEGAVCRLGARRRHAPSAAPLVRRTTIFTGVTPEMRIAREEVFGPVLSVIPFDDEDEAVRIANDTITDSRRASGRPACAARFPCPSASKQAPCGEHLSRGELHVAVWRLQALGHRTRKRAEAIREYLQTKSVWIDTAGNAPNPFVMR